MVTSKKESFACENDNDRTAVIQTLNDMLRCTGVGGQTLVTPCGHTPRRTKRYRSHLRRQRPPVRTVSGAPC
jgi:hypothetical protein